MDKNEDPEAIIEEEVVETAVDEVVETAVEEDRCAEDKEEMSVGDHIKKPGQCYMLYVIRYM